MANIYKGTLGLIGNTPLVEVVNIEKELGLEATVLVKLGQDLIERLANILRISTRQRMAIFASVNVHLLLRVGVVMKLYHAIIAIFVVSLLLISQKEII